MAELLKVALSGFWPFVGTVFLLAVAACGVANVVLAFRGKVGYFAEAKATPAPEPGEFVLPAMGDPINSSRPWLGAGFLTVRLRRGCFGVPAGYHAWAAVSAHHDQALVRLPRGWFLLNAGVWEIAPMPSDEPKVCADAGNVS